MKNDIIKPILYISTFLLALVYSTKTFAQADTNTYEMIEVMPEFPGGVIAMNKYIIENLVYPQEALENGIFGKVYIQFTVRKDGSIADVNSLRPTHPLLDEEAIRVVSSMPPWSPGILNGQPVNVRHSLPLHFKIN
ncbi:MAG: energy transducer TonB [Flavobacteriales bacterium]